MLVDRLRTDLPAPQSSLVGREQHMADLLGLLQAGKQRIVTLTGPGGVGKTRLAIEAARRATPIFPDGVHFVRLADAREPDHVLWAISSALRIGRESQRLALDAIAAFLAGRKVLLVLDNFEQLYPAAGVLTELVERTELLRILVTSRGPLRLAGEQEVLVQPLAVSFEADHSPDHPARASAVQLFVDRARSVGRAFELTDAGERDIADLCSRLDGLPLAIELAAARIRLMSPAEMLKRLHHHPTSLGPGRRDAPPRQQTLNATIAWSYDLLRPADKTLFRRLAVFAGGFTIEAVEAVVAALGDERHQYEAVDIVERIDALADVALVRRVSQPHAATRFALLNTIRGYALARLGESGEHDTVREALATWAIGLARFLRADDHSAEITAALDRVEPDMENMRSALRWLSESGQGARLLEFSTNLVAFWSRRGHLAEALEWLSIAIEMAPNPTAEERFRAIYAMAWMSSFAGSHDNAREHAAEALALDEGGLDGDAGARRRNLLNVLGGLAYNRGDFDDAERYFDDAIRGLEPGGKRTAQLIGVLHNLGVVASARAQHALAREYHERSLRLARDANLERDIYGNLTRLAEIAVDVGNIPEAIPLLQETAAHFASTREGTHIGDVLATAARIAFASGDIHLAAAFYGGLLELLDRTGYVSSPPGNVLVTRLVEAGRRELGDDAFDNAVDLGRRTPTPELLSQITEMPLSAPGGSRTDPTIPLGLTARELDIVRLLAGGSSNAQIASALFISPRTVQTHVANILAKLGLTSRAAVAALAVRNGIV